MMRCIAEMEKRVEKSVLDNNALVQKLNIEELQKTGETVPNRLYIEQALYFKLFTTCIALGLHKNDSDCNIYEQMTDLLNENDYDITISHLNGAFVIDGSEDFLKLKLTV